MIGWLRRWPVRRSVTALVLLPFLWLGITRTDARLFLFFTLVIVAWTGWEAFRMLSREGAEPLRVLGFPASLALAAGFSPLVSIPVVPVLTALICGSLVMAMAVRGTPRDMVDSVSATLLGTVLVGPTLGHLVGLHTLGRDWLIALFAIVFAADTFAFFVGKSLGRRKLAPTISPNKSWEGLLGGLVGSALVLQVAHPWILEELDRIELLAIGVLVAFASVLGDLAISALKRACGRKDASSLLPGHGGLLDRADSLLLATPTLYWLARLVT